LPTALRRRSKRAAENIRDVVAAAVEPPHPIRVATRQAPAKVIPARRLLRSDRDVGAKLTRYDRRTAKAQLGTGGSADRIKKIVVSNLNQAGRASGLNHHLGEIEANHPIAVEILLENRLKRFQRRIGPRRGAENIRDVVAAAVEPPHPIRVATRQAPAKVIPARRLLRSDRDVGAKLTERAVRRYVSKRRTAPFCLNHLVMRVMPFQKGNQLGKNQTNQRRDTTIELIAQLNEMTSRIDGTKNTNLQRMVSNLIAKATTAFDEYNSNGELIKEGTGDLQAITEIMNRLDGKPSQKLYCEDCG
jgi:hypothetical protein